MLKLLGFLGLIGCASVPTTTTTTVTEPRTRSVGQQFNAALTIHLLCVGPSGAKAGMLGSGVILTDTRMLTTYHVVDDKGCVYYAESRDKVKHVMTLRNESEALDLAEFVVSPPFAPELVSDFEFADAGETGEELCATAVFPQVSRFCGDLSPIHHGEGMDLEWFGIVQPGNSGSGVYNSRGQLVAITTRVRVCGNGQYCFAYGSSIRKAPWW